MWVILNKEMPKHSNSSEVADDIYAHDQRDYYRMEEEGKLLAFGLVVAMRDNHHLYVYISFKSHD
jgi:hypothetical protein